MKKLLFGICLFCFVSAQAFDCTDGDILTGKNGQDYCTSRVKMNWFTAFIWCESQGMRLQTMSEICDNGSNKWDGNLGKNKCHNFNDINMNRKVLWSATPGGNNMVFLLNNNNQVAQFPANNVQNWDGVPAVATCR